MKMVTSRDKTLWAAPICSAWPTRCGSAFGGGGAHGSRPSSLVPLNPGDADADEGGAEELGRREVFAKDQPSEEGGGDDWKRQVATMPLKQTMAMGHPVFPRQHFLYFLPLPHGHGSFRPIFRVTGSAARRFAPASRFLLAKPTSLMSSYLCCR